MELIYQLHITTTSKEAAVSIVYVPLIVEFHQMDGYNTCGPNGDFDIYSGIYVFPDPLLDVIVRRTILLKYRIAHMRSRRVFLVALSAFRVSSGRSYTYRKFKFTHPKKEKSEYLLERTREGGCMGGIIALFWVDM